MSSDYYSLEKTAEILGINAAEVNRLRDRGELRAFRDGVNWKFRKGEVDDYLVRAIRSRRQNDENLLSSNEDDEEEEMPTLLADTAAFDLMMEDGLGGSSLAINEDLIEKPVAKPVAAPKPAPASADLSLGDDDLLLASDGLSLADDTPVPVGGTLAASPIFTEASDGGSALDLADEGDDQVLSGSSTANDLNLASDSGLSLLEADDDVVLETVSAGGSDAILELDDDDDLLALVDENQPTMMVAAEDDFQLVPDQSMEADDSESSSQVIALEEDNIFGPISAEDTPGADMGGGVPAGAFGDFGGAMPAPAFGGAPTPGGAPAPGYAPTSFPAGAYAPQAPSEPVYSPLWISLSLGTVVFIAFAGWMIIDMVQNMWSWRGDHTIMSPVLDTLAGLCGLK